MLVFQLNGCLNFKKQAKLMNEIILIITLGFSPGSANHTSLEVLEYVQPDMKTCTVEQEKVNNFSDGRFEYHSLCVKRLQTNKRR